MKICHLICNAHLDPVWLWDWEEGMASALSTFRSAARLAQEFEYIFCHNEALLYEWVEEYDPDLFQEIRELVEAGRWKIIGGWYLQPDCNLLSSESLIRQIMVGRRYFHSRFGVEPTTAVNFDSFGHSRGMVQILRKAGYDSYLICRPGAEESCFPDDFLWEGVDGSTISVCRVASHYNSVKGQADQKIQSVLEREKNKSVGIVLWGVGNHGGGPSGIDLQRINQLIHQSAVEICHSTPERYMAENKGLLAKVTSSLNPCMPGCYTSMAQMKQLHRQLEGELFKTEKMASAAALLYQLPYAFEAFERAEKDLMFAEFHDILPGSCIQAGEETGLRKLYHGLEEMNQVRARSFLALTQGQKTAEPGKVPILAYNPHPYPIEVTLEVDFILENQNYQDFITTFSARMDGCEMPIQMLKESSNMTLDWAKKVAIDCRLAPMSMNRLDLCSSKVFTPLELNQSAENFWLEGEHCKVWVDPQTGLLSHYEVEGLVLLNQPMLPALYSDNADPWGMSPQQRVQLGEKIGVFQLMDSQACMEFTGGEEPFAPVRIIEDGSVVKEIEALFQYHQSFLRINYCLYYGHPWIDIKLQFHFLEKNRMVKLLLPDCLKGEVVGQIIGGVEAIPSSGAERPIQKWACAQNHTAALAVINKGTHGMSWNGEAMLFSLLRGVAYAAHPIPGRSLLQKDKVIPRLDQGERNFFFRLLGGPRTWVERQREQVACVLQEPPFALSLFPKGDGGSVSTPLFEISPSPIVLQALKKSREGSYVLRLYNPLGEKVHCQISSSPMLWEEKLEFKPYEIKTFLAERGVWQACSTLAI